MNEIKFENGLTGVLRAVEDEAESLSLFEIDVNGQRFICLEEQRAELAKFLNGIPGENVSLTALYSVDVKLKPVRQGKGKKKTIEQDEQHKATHYHGTVQLSKDALWQVFEETAERCRQYVEIMAEGALQVMAKEKGPEKTRRERECLNAGADI